MIQKAVLNIFDSNSSNVTYSQREMDFTNGCATEYISKHVEKAFYDDNQKKGSFCAESKLQTIVKAFDPEASDFVTLSGQITELIAQVISNADVQKSYDLLLGLYSENEVQYLAILIFANKSAFTHTICHDEDAIYTQIVKHNSILPSTTQKTDGYAFINLSDWSLLFSDFKQEMNGEKVAVLQDRILECSANQSQKAVLQTVTKIADQVAAEYGEPAAKTVSKIKDYILTRAADNEEKEPLNTIELGRKIFSEAPQMREKYVNEIQKKEIPEKVELTKSFAVKSSKSQKIKTDTGIEISFPPGYYDNDRYMKILNNSDGTLSIEIKNVGKISSK